MNKDTKEMDSKENGQLERERENEGEKERDRERKIPGDDPLQEIRSPLVASSRLWSQVSKNSLKPEKQSNSRSFQRFHGPQF